MNDTDRIFHLSNIFAFNGTVYDHYILFNYSMARQCWPIGQNFGEWSILNPTFVGFEEISCYWSIQFVYFFLCFSMVIISRQTLYDSSIFRPDYRIIRGFIGHHQSTDLV